MGSSAGRLYHFAKTMRWWFSASMQWAGGNDLHTTVVLHRAEVCESVAGEIWGGVLAHTWELARIQPQVWRKPCGF